MRLHRALCRPSAQRTRRVGRGRGTVQIAPGGRCPSKRKESTMQVLTERPAAPKAERVTLAVEGLSCGGGGALAAERALAQLPGVVRVYVNAATEMAYVEYTPALCSATGLQ